MVIEGIKKGVVIDHIKAGRGMRIYHFLELEKLENQDCSVAIIKNVKSAKHGRKDIIKIENRIDFDFDVLGYIDPNITVNIVEDEKISSKVQLKLPERVTNVIRCKNPRCITSVEQEIEHEFRLSDPDNRTYRCVYCEQEARG